MTTLRSCINGIYPRSEALIQATRDLDRARTTREAVDAQFEADLEALIALQQEAGLDLLSDGMLRWQDIFRPLVEAADGLRVGPLTRFFDNNAFFKQPVITGQPSLNGRIGREFFPSHRLPQGKPWKAVLPSPYLFSRVCHDDFFGNPDRAMMALAADVLRPIVEALDEAGCALIQFNEPYLVYHAERSAPGQCTGGARHGLPDEDLGPFREAMVLLTEGLKARTCLHTYFGSAAPLMDLLLSFEVDVLGIDFVATDLEALGGRDFPKELLCGCLDARNSLVERQEQVVKFVEQVIDELAPPTLYLTTNCDLEYLPEAVAREKVRLIGDVTRVLKT